MKKSDWLFVNAYARSYLGRGHKFAWVNLGMWMRGTHWKEGI